MPLYRHGLGTRFPLRAYTQGLGFTSHLHHLLSRAGFARRQRGVRGERHPFLFRYRFDQVSYCPKCLRYPGSHNWCDFQAAVNSDKVVVSKMQCDSRF